MDGSVTEALIEQVNGLIKEARLNDDNSQLLIDSFSHLDGIANAIFEEDYSKVLSEKWRLEAMLTMETKIDECLKIIKEKGDIDNVMHDSLVHIMKVFFKTFNFCHCAGKMCSEQPEDVTERLSLLFKLCYQNIKSVMDALETFQNVFSADENHLYEVLVNLIKCSQVLADIDIMASVAVWKSIKRLYFLHRDIVGNDLLKFHCLFDLCGITYNTLNVCFELLEKKDNGINNKYQKVIRFFLGIILFLTEDFKEVMTVEVACKVYKLIYLIQKLSLVETRKDFESRGCSTEYDAFYNSILCVNDLLIKNFAQVECAAQSIMGTLDNNRNEQYDELIFLLIIINLTECLTEEPQFITPWMTPCVNTLEGRQSLLHIIFSSAEQCSFSLFAQRKDHAVVDKSKCLKETPLYQILLGKLCAFVITLGPDYFSELEKVLLSNVLHGSKYCVLLASDVWCFISRWGKAELCLSHFIFLGKLLLYFSDNNSDYNSISNVSYILQRLFWILEDNQHGKITESFPVTPANIIFWRLIPLSHVNINKKEISSQIVEISLSLIDESKEKESRLRRIICGIQCLNNLISQEDIYLDLSDTQKKDINEHIYCFWSRLTQNKDYVEVNDFTVVEMLDLTSKSLRHLKRRDIYNILSILNSILQHSVNQAFQLKCAYFLMCMKDITFEPDMESECLLLISKMSQLLMTQRDWIVEDSSMKALQRFAQETNYSHALVTFLPSSKKKDFTCYLKKMTTSVDLTGNDLIGAVLKYISRNGHKDLLSVCIDKIEENAKGLKMLMQGHSVPPQFLERITNIISVLECACR